MTTTQSLVNVGGVGLPIDFPDDFLDKKEGDEYYLNVEGDQMTGRLQMNSQRIIQVGAPQTGGDAATKFYVDDQIEKLKKSIKLNVVDKVLNLQRKAGDNSIHIERKYEAASKEITALKHFLGKKIPRFNRIEGVIANAKNVNNLVFNFDRNTSIQKNFIIIQALIETKPGVWFDLYLLSPSYIFRIYQKGNRLFIVSPRQLPNDWTRKINLTCTKLD